MLSLLRTAVSAPRSLQSRPYLISLLSHPTLVPPRSLMLRMLTRNHPGHHGGVFRHAARRLCINHKHFNFKRELISPLSDADMLSTPGNVLPAQYSVMQVVTSRSRRNVSFTLLDQYYVTALRVGLLGLKLPPRSK